MKNEGLISLALLVGQESTRTYKLDLDAPLAFADVDPMAISIVVELLLVHGHDPGDVFYNLLDLSHALYLSAATGEYKWRGPVLGGDKSISPAGLAAHVHALGEDEPSMDEMFWLVQIALFWMHLILRLVEGYATDFVLNTEGVRA